MKQRQTQTRRKWAAKEFKDCWKTPEAEQGEILSCRFQREYGSADILILDL